MLISTAEDWFQAIGMHNYPAVRANIATYQKSVDEKGETGLMRAVRAKDIEMVHLLASFEHSMRNANGHTALMIAASINSADICQKLAPYEMNLSTEDNRSALMMAAAEGSVDAIISLLPYQKCRADIDGKTAMMHAVLNRRFDAVKQLSLRETGYMDLSGKTAYVIALELDFQEIANFLAPLESAFLPDTRESYGSAGRNSIISNNPYTTIHSSSPQAPILRSSQGHTSVTHTSNTHPPTTSGSSLPSRTSTSRDSRSDVHSSQSQPYSSSVEPPPYISVSANKPRLTSGLIHVSSMPPQRAGSNLGGREVDGNERQRASEQASITPNPNAFRARGVRYGKTDGTTAMRISLLSKSVEPEGEHLAIEDLSTRKSISTDSRSSFLQAYANTFKEVNSLRQSMSTRSSQLSRSSAHIDAQQRLQLASTVTDKMDSLEMKMVALVQSNMELAAENQALKARINKAHDGSGPESIISLVGTLSVEPESRKNSLFSKPAEPSNDPSEGEVFYDPTNSLLAVKMHDLKVNMDDQQNVMRKPPLPKSTSPNKQADTSSEQPRESTDHSRPFSADTDQKDKELERLATENALFQKQIRELKKQLALATNVPTEKLADEYPADFCTDSDNTSLSDIDIVCHDLSDRIPSTQILAPLPQPPTTKMNRERQILELEAQKEALTQEVARLEQLLYHKATEPSLLSSQLGQAQKNNATEMSSPTLSEVDPMELCSGPEMGSVKHMHSTMDSKASELDHGGIHEDRMLCMRDFGLCTEETYEPETDAGKGIESPLEQAQKRLYEERIEALEAQLRVYQQQNNSNIDSRSLEPNGVDKASPFIQEIHIKDDDTIETLRQKVEKLNTEGKRMRANSKATEQRLQKVESINDDLLDIVHAKENEILALRITLDRASLLISPKINASRLGLTELSWDRKDVMSTASASHISDNSILAFGQQGAPTTQTIQSMLGITDSKLNTSYEYYEQRDVPLELMGPTGTDRISQNPFSPFDTRRVNINTHFMPSKLNVFAGQKRRAISAEIGNRNGARPLRPPSSIIVTPATLAADNTTRSPPRPQSSTKENRTSIRKQVLAPNSVDRRPSSGVATWKDDLAVNYITRDMYHSTHSITDLSIDSPEKVDENIHNLHVSIVDCVRASVDSAEERASLGSTQHEQELSNDAAKLMEKLDYYQNDIVEFTEKNSRLMERLDKLDTEYKELAMIHRELMNTKRAKEEVINALEQKSQASQRNSIARTSEGDTSKS